MRLLRAAVHHDAGTDSSSARCGCRSSAIYASAGLFRCFHKPRVTATVAVSVRRG